jgi:hypothetical protein
MKRWNKILKNKSKKECGYTNYIFKEKNINKQMTAMFFSQMLNCHGFTIDLDILFMV